MSSNIELINQFHHENSVLTASNLIHIKNKNLKESPILSKNLLLGFYSHLYGYIKNHFHCANEFSIHNGHPYLNFHYNGELFSYLFIGYGAPLAGMLLDESISLGGEKFLFIGPAGSLNKDVYKNKVCIPTSSIRDEGTSFHYEASGRYSYPDSDLVHLIQTVLIKDSIDFMIGRNWTTDAIYRETPGKIESVLSDNAISVDMEASALFSIAKHYNKRIAGLFLISDIITADSFSIAKRNRIHPSTTPNELFEISLKILHDFSYT